MVRGGGALNNVQRQTLFRSSRFNEFCVHVTRLRRDYLSKLHGGKFFACDAKMAATSGDAMRT